MTTPELDISILVPRAFTIDVIGTSLEGGRSVIGNAPDSIDYSGGGFWTVEYDIVSVFTPAQHRYLNVLSALLSSGSQKIVVPFLTDWTAPILTDSHGEPVLPPVTLPAAALTSNAALNAGTVSFSQTAGAEIKAGMIFEIDHATRGKRAYRIVSIDTETPLTDHTLYTVAIKPPLREASATSTALRFYRPRCLMQLKPGTVASWKVEKWWKGQSTLSFWEARWDT